MQRESKLRGPVRCERQPSTPGSNEQDAPESFRRMGSGNTLQEKTSDVVIILDKTGREKL
jgi:hypothetical protein